MFRKAQSDLTMHLVINCEGMGCYNSICSQCPTPDTAILLPHPNLKCSISVRPTGIIVRLVQIIHQMQLSLIICLEAFL